jgi:ABC-2 type transport system permease protein
MLNQILAMVRKDLKIFFKDPGAVTLVLVQPLMFILIMSYALSGLFHGGDQAIQILIINEDGGRQSKAVIEGIGSTKGFEAETGWEGRALTREIAEQLIRKHRRAMALVFPPGFSAALERAPGARDRQTTQVIFIVDPATPAQLVEPVTGTVKGLLERAAYAAAMPKGIDYMYNQLFPRTPQSEREAFKERARESMSGGLLSGQTPVVTVNKVAPKGMNPQRTPNAFEQNVPGYTIYGLFWIVSLLAGSVLREKREGTLRRLLVAPVGRATVLLGKIIPCYIINLIQLALVLIVAKTLFAMSLGASPLGLLLVSLALAASATGLGVLVAALARSEAQAGGLTVLLLLSLSALGGCFVPRFVMPVWLRNVGLATPHAWALDAYQDLLVRGYGLTAVLPGAAVLCGFAALFFFVGMWRFRFQ